MIHIAKNLQENITIIAKCEKTEIQKSTKLGMEKFGELSWEPWADKVIRKPSPSYKLVFCNL